MDVKVTELINGYQLEWGTPHNLSVRATRLRLAADSQIRGQLEIKRTDETRAILLVPAQFNFSSETTRAKFAAQLRDKLALDIEWKEVFDRLCQEVQERVCTGDKAVEVFPDPNSPAPEQLLQGLIYKGAQNIIFGEKGVMKSTLAYLLGMCVTLPWTDNPLDLSVPRESIKTLVLDWETDESIFRYCVSRLQKGMNIPVCSLHYRRCALPLIDDIEAIQKHIEDSHSELVIIDSLGAAAGGERGELKGSEAALLFNAALRKLKRTSLIIGQTAKGDTDGRKKTIFGSTYFTYYARNIFELCAGEDNYGSAQHLGLFHRECNLGKKMQPIGFRLEFDEDGAIKLEREPLSIAEFTQKVSTSMRILEALKGGKMTPKELKETLDVSYPNLSGALKRLAKHKKIVKIDNAWSLMTTEGQLTS